MTQLDTTGIELSMLRNRASLDFKGFAKSATWCFTKGQDSLASENPQTGDFTLTPPHPNRALELRFL